MSKNKKNYKGTYFLSSISLTSTLVEYGISSIFVIFLMNMLHFSFDLTSETYAYYYSFAFFLPILIGYISDKYLKITTTIILGFLSMIASQIFLFLCSSLYDPSGAVQNNLILNAQTSLYILGLIFLATGTSFTSLSFTHLINLLIELPRLWRSRGFLLHGLILSHESKITVLSPLLQRFIVSSIKSVNPCFRMFLAAFMSRSCVFWHCGHFHSVSYFRSLL